MKFYKNRALFWAQQMLELQLVAFAIEMEGQVQVHCGLSLMHF